MSPGPFTSAVSVDDDAMRLGSAPVAEVFNLASVRRKRAASVTLDQRLERAGLAIASYLFTAYDGTDADEDGPCAHAGTMVAILATLAAEAALQAAEVATRKPLDITRDGWVQGGPADGLLFRLGHEYAGSAAIGSSVWDCVVEGARSVGSTVPNASDLESMVARAEAHLGMKPCPILTVPVPFRPRALLRPAAARNRHEATALAAEAGLYAAPEIALALGAAIAQVIRHEPDADVLTRLAAETMIGAARLSPLPFALN